MLKNLSASPEFEKTNAVLAAGKALDHLSNIVTPLECFSRRVQAPLARLAGPVTVGCPQRDGLPVAIMIGTEVPMPPIWLHTVEIGRKAVRIERQRKAHRHVFGFYKIF